MHTIQFQRNAATQHSHPKDTHICIPTVRWVLANTCSIEKTGNPGNVSAHATMQQGLTPGIVTTLRYCSAYSYQRPGKTIFPLATAVASKHGTILVLLASTAYATF
jgi:hypothetical protein